MEPGDSWNVPCDVAHRADILEDSIALEVFSPCRQDYLKFVNAGELTGENVAIILFVGEYE